MYGYDRHSAFDEDTGDVVTYWTCRTCGLVRLSAPTGPHHGLDSHENMDEDPAAQSEPPTTGGY